MRFSPRIRAALALSTLSACALLACDDGTGPEEQVVGPPAFLLIVSGDSQTAIVGTQLTSPLVVRVVDADSQPVPGQLVNFVVVSGGGSVFAGAALTNSNGLAQELWTLGTSTSGEQRVEVRAVDPETGAPLVFATFEATALADAPATLAVVGGDAQEAGAGETLGDSLVARVEDQYGNAVSDVTVTWSTDAPNAAVGPAQTSDGDGRVTASWTLGTVLGEQTATAQSAELAATFTANAVTPSVAVEPAAGDSQSAAVGSALAQPLQVRVTTSAGLPIQGQTIEFVVTSGNGSVATSTAITDADGVAATTFTLGTVSGEQSVEARALDSRNGEPRGAATFVATATPLAAAQLTVVDPVFEQQTVGQPLEDSVVVRATDALGNPVPGIVVEWSSSHGGSASPASGVTDATGTARTEWTLGTVAGDQVLTATAAGLSVEVLASGIPGAPAALRIVPDSVYYSRHDYVQLRAVEFDQFGNEIGNTTAVWTELDRTHVIIVGRDPRFIYPDPVAAVTIAPVWNGVGRVAASNAAGADTALAYVNRVPVSLVITGSDGIPQCQLLEVGQSVRCVAEVRDSSDFVMPAVPTWTSSDTTIVHVNASGDMTARGPGTASVVAQYGLVADTVSFTIYPIDNTPPVVTVTAPFGEAYATPGFRVTASCTDDVGCLRLTASIRTSRGTFEVASGTTGIDTIVTVSEFAYEEVTLIVEGFDHKNSTRVEHVVRVEPSTVLQFVTQVPGQILAADAGRIVYWDEQADPNVDIILFDIATGTTTRIPIASVNRFAVRLTPTGLLVGRTDGMLVEWRSDGTTRDLGATHVGITDVDGDYAIWSYAYASGKNRSFRYQFSTQTLTSIGDSTNAVDVLSNGIVYYYTDPTPAPGSTTSLYRWHETAGAILVEGDPNYTITAAKGDGDAVVYMRNPPGPDVLVLRTPAGATNIVTSRFIGSFFFENGHIAYVAFDAANVAQVYHRSPAGLVTRLSNASSHSQLSSMGQNGAITFITGARRYYWNPAVGGVPVEISGSWGFETWDGDELFVMLGSLLFGVAQ